MNQNHHQARRSYAVSKGSKGSTTIAAVADASVPPKREASHKWSRISSQKYSQAKPGRSSRGDVCLPDVADDVIKDVENLSPESEDPTITVLGCLVYPRAEFFEKGSFWEVLATHFILPLVL